METQNWIPRELSLTGEHVTLKPLALEHKEALLNAAADGELWALRVTSVPDSKSIDQYLANAIEQSKKGCQRPFVVYRNLDEKIVGCTRYYDIEPTHRNLAIGYTWYAESAQRTAVNTDTKRLLLGYAFEQLGCISVAFHTDDLNKRSQAAIQRLGAKFEGVLRNHRIMPDGRLRHTWCYSITQEEWPDIKLSLKEKLERVYSD